MNTPSPHRGGPQKFPGGNFIFSGLLYGGYDIMIKYEDEWA